jgi:RNA recognition motif-containing protein
MPKKPNYGFERLKREQNREARAAARRARKKERTEAISGMATGGREDLDLAGIVAGPQRKDHVSQEEARQAAERAMNPGKQHTGEAERARGSRLFAGNLDFGVEEQDLHTLFTEAGFTVSEVTVVKDRDTGQSRGFAFVEVVGRSEAARAVAELDGVELAGRVIRLNMAEKQGRR